MSLMPADMTEDQFDGLLFRKKDAVANLLGWHSYHTLRSRGSKAGYPDRTCWKNRVLFAELKSESGKPTDRQVATLDQLARAGAEAYLWRPSDLKEIARILGRPWRFLGQPGTPELGLSLGSGAYTDTWTPRSLWIAGKGRHHA